VRGHVEILVAPEPLMPGFSRDVLRVRARKIIAWNLDGPSYNTRLIAVPSR
jgi:pyridoxamine 5'-phosphate oxidase family protein